MRSVLIPLFISLLLCHCSQPGDNSTQTSADSSASAPQPPRRKQYALVIHGGAGNIKRDMDPKRRLAHEEGIRQALAVGKEILERGGTSLEAVEAAVRSLEDNPEFNAGRGAVVTAEGTHELDAAIMDGRTLDCGAVTGVTTVKNPISLARLVMQESPHVFFWNDGAEQFADRMKVERVKNSYFTTEEMAVRYQKQKQKQKQKLSASLVTAPDTYPFALGTVGAVALDRQGNLAAATSTGGRFGKAHGRIGDSPVIGAGTYANNETCAISATGAGEEFIRRCVAYDVSARMAYGKLSLAEAARQVIGQQLKPGDGGIIGVDRYGNTIQQYNTTGMYRGAADSDGTFRVQIWE